MKLSEAFPAPPFLKPQGTSGQPAGASSVPSPRACTVTTAHSQLWAGQESCCCLTGAQIQQNVPTFPCSSQQPCPQAQTTLFSHSLPMKRFVGLVSVFWLLFLFVSLRCFKADPRVKLEDRKITPGPFHFTLVSSPSCHCHHRRPQGGGLGKSCSDRAVPFPEPWEPIPGAADRENPPLTALLLSFPSPPVEKLLPHQHSPVLHSSLCQEQRLSSSKAAFCYSLSCS